MFKDLIAEQLRNNGYEVFKEFKIKIKGDFSANRRAGPNRHIVVDIFAVKNQTEYVCEIGQVTEKDRIELLEYCFDRVDHLQMNWNNSRDGKKFDKITGIKYSYKKENERVVKQLDVMKTVNGFL